MVLCKIHEICTVRKAVEAGAGMVFFTAAHVAVDNMPPGHDLTAGQVCNDTSMAIEK